MTLASESRSGTTITPLLHNLEVGCSSQPPRTISLRPERSMSAISDCKPLKDGYMRPSAAPTLCDVKPALRSTKLTWLPRIALGEACGLEECPYFRRWVLEWPSFSIRLHHWRDGDDPRAYHDHAWSFLTLVLWGGYTDVSPAGRDTLRFGSVRWRPADWRHTVSEMIPGTWTLVITKGRRRHWSFFVDGHKVGRDRFFKTYGHHPCDPAGKPVRKRPDGSRYD